MSEKKDKKNGWETYVDSAKTFNKFFIQDENSKVGYVCLGLMVGLIYVIVRVLLCLLVFHDEIGWTTTIAVAVALTVVFSLLTKKYSK